MMKVGRLPTSSFDYSLFDIRHSIPYLCDPSNKMFFEKRLETITEEARQGSPCGERLKGVI